MGQIEWLTRYEKPRQRRPRWPWILVAALIILGVKGVLKIDLEAIMKMESGGNAKAFNYGTKATGLFQIRPICLDDWNLNHPREQKTLNDLWDPTTNRRIADWYLHTRIPQLLQHYKVPNDELELVLSAYNWGPKNAAAWHWKGRTTTDLPKETRDYISKYNALTSGGTKK